MTNQEGPKDTSARHSSVPREPTGASAPGSAAELAGQSAARRRAKRHLLTGGIFLVVAGGMGTLSLQFERIEQDHMSSSSEVTADLSAGKLKDYISARVIAVDLLRRDLASLGLRDKPEAFQRRSLAIRDQLGGYRAINWVDETGVIRLTSPVETNTQALGRSVLDQPGAKAVFTAVRRDGQARATPPLKLFQGGHGFASYVAVDPKQPELGYVNVVFDAQGLIERCFGSEYLASERLRVMDGEHIVYESRGFEHSITPIAVDTLEVFDRSWTLEVRARPPLLSRAGHRWLHAVSLLFAAGVALSVHFALRRAEEREREERERRELAERLQESAKLEAIGLLAGGVAHDFNNLLTVVQSNLVVLREGRPLDEAETAAADEIEDAARRGGELTQQLLAFSRKQVVLPRAVEVDATLGRVDSMLRRVLRENIQIKLQLDAAGACALIDPGQLDRALINLALNAGDAMPDGGVLTFRSFSQGDVVCIEVQDDGVGMAPEVLAHAFEPFFTTKAVGKGTGLGLATVYGVVSQAGGEVTVSSKLGQGALFRITLPRSDDPPVTEARQSSESRRIPQIVKLLLVEDDPAVRRGAARTLRRDGYDVTEAPNGAEALKLWDPSFQLLVTDAVMPEMGGRALIEALRAKAPSLGVVLMSGHSEDVLGDTINRLDVVYLPKPYTPEQLSQALRAALRRERSSRRMETAHPSA